MSRDDTIAAIATAAAASGIGVLRISGTRAAAIATKITGVTLRPRHAHFCAFRDENHDILDRGVALHFVAPHSYTGEDVVELQAHGSPVLLGLLLKRTLELGARMARPGEFSERAYLNGKLDLTQAEAVADLIASTSEAAARAAMRSLEGKFSAQVNQILASLVRVRTWLEAALDFPDEEIDFLSTPQLSQDLRALQQALQALLLATRRGVVLRDGLHVVIVGRPNVGKSSLLNALAQSDRAIVTPVAGTTRDTLRESINVGGAVITLVDTAGLHETNDAIEREGMRRARAELARADVALLVTDVDDVLADSALLDACNAQATRITLHNKIDLRGVPARRETTPDAQTHLYVSARDGSGVDLVRSELSRLSGNDSEIQGTFSARSRHVRALELTRAHLQLASDNLDAHMAEIAAEELRRAQQTLSEITGEFSSDDLLGSIFSSFCIGK